MIYWEDVVPGTRRDYGTYTFSEDEIIRFAKRYDPQPFHVDPEAARRSYFGGIIASGWHTASVWMKLAVADRDKPGSDSSLLRAGVSPGYEDMRWLKPVRPGMTLSFSSEVTGKVALRSRPELGIVVSRNEARDEAGELVFSFLGKALVQRRPR